MTDQTSEQYDWIDIDGDEGHLTLDDIGAPGVHPAIAQFQIFDRRSHSEHGVYVTPDQARDIIAWLSRRLELAA